MIEPKDFSAIVSQKNSFDFIRFLFAFSVFIAHFGILSSIPVYWPISSTMGVTGFFIISGFLITRSYYRSKNLTDYILKRIKRIVPAYVAVVLLCAFLFSLVSAFPLTEYFSSKDFIKYLIANLSFLNFLQPTLPGVFTTNLFPYVNGSLWTIKVEITLYALVPLMAYFMKNKKPIFILAALYILSHCFILLMNHLHTISDNNSIFLILRRQFLGQITFFISGAIVLFYFDQLNSKIKLILPVSIVIFFLKFFRFDMKVIDFLYPFSFAIIIIFFAYKMKWLARFSKYGDISYGFYLFHFPVIQLFVYLEIFKENSILLFLACFLTTTILSFLSWNFIEKKFLKRRRYS